MPTTASTRMQWLVVVIVVLVQGCSAQDTTPPVITCPPSGTVNTDAGFPYATVSWQATAIDNITPSPTIACNATSPSKFTIGKTYVRCTATDAANNAASCIFIYTVLDVEAPRITCPTSQRLSAVLGGTTRTFNWQSSIIGNDNSGALPSYACNYSSSVFNMGPTAIKCSGVDPSGNVGSCTFVITVVDLEAPTVVCPSSVTTTPDPQPLTTRRLTWTFSPVDNLDGTNVITTCSMFFPYNFPYGVTTPVNCNFTDHAGNAARCYWSVTVTGVNMCGDNVCNNGETCSTCSQDCGLCADCNDNFCNPIMENCTFCPEDCGFCTVQDVRIIRREALMVNLRFITTAPATAYEQQQFMSGVEKDLANALGAPQSRFKSVSLTLSQAAASFSINVEFLPSLNLTLDGSRNPSPGFLYWQLAAQLQSYQNKIFSGTYTWFAELGQSPSATPVPMQLCASGVQFAALGQCPEDLNNGGGGGGLSTASVLMYCGIAAGGVVLLCCIAKCVGDASKSMCECCLTDVEKERQERQELLNAKMRASKVVLKRLSAVQPLANIHSKSSFAGKADMPPPMPPTTPRSMYSRRDDAAAGLQPMKTVNAPEFEQLSARRVSVDYGNLPTSSSTQDLLQPTRPDSAMSTSSQNKRPFIPPLDPRRLSIA